MKNTIMLSLSLLSLHAYAQTDVPVINQEDIPLSFKGATHPEEILNFSEAEINKLIEVSRQEVEKIVGKDDIKKMSPTIQIHYLKTDLLPGPHNDSNPHFRSLRMLSNPAFGCFEKKGKTGEVFSFVSQVNGVIERTEHDPKDKRRRHNGGMIYLMWGYHKGFHENSDITVKTPDGTFTIHDSQGVDRPSRGILTYLDPTKLSQPQYNIRLGYQFNEKWGVEFGNDHMKWVYVHNPQGYKITGDYKDVWYGTEKVSFDTVKQTGYMPWHMEHTDGYNYVNLGAVYSQKLFESKNQAFRLDAQAGAGLGAIVTRTRTMIHDQDDTSAIRDLDAPFKLAGWGAHASAGIKISYVNKSGKEFYLRPEFRTVYGKINSAPFLNEGTIEHSGFFSRQYGIYGGVSIPVDQVRGMFKKKKKVID